MAAKKASQAAVWVILLLLIVGLMGFGATSFGGGQQTVAQVGDVKITADRYVRSLQNEINGFSQQLRRPLTISEAQGLGIDQAVLSRLIAEAALEDEIRDLGLSVGDETVGEEILAIPAFRGMDGEFDRDTYSFTLERSGFSVGEFEETIRRDMAAQLLQTAVRAGVTMPDAYVQSLFNFAREQRDATYAILGESDLSEPLPLATDDQLRSYYEANPAEFTRPETRVITYAALTPAMLADSVTVSEDRVRDLYDSRADEYVQEERRLVERLVYRSEADAADAATRLEDGSATFDDLVAERGLTLADIDLGDVTAARLGEAAPGVFELEEPGVAGPLPTSLGPALFRVNAILPRREIAFEDVADELRQGLREDAAHVVIREQLEDFDDLLAGGATLEELADETDMQVETVQWDATAADGLLATGEFRQAVQTAEVGDFPELVETADGAVFALRLDEILPPALLPLSDVEPQVRDALRDSQRADALEALANDLATQLREGRTPASLAPEFTSAQAVLRDDTGTDLSVATLAELFGMEDGDIRVVRDGNTVTLLILDAVAAPDPEAPENTAALTAVTGATADTLSADLATTFTEAIIDDAQLRIDQQALNAINAQLY